MHHDQHIMATCLRLAKHQQGVTWPNPAVGCIIVKDGAIIARGVTAKGGRPHAETQALQKAGTSAFGATLYVTLEPCAHHGQTPPCVDAIIAAKIARVVIGMTDPDPRTSGKSIQKLRAAGIVIETFPKDENLARHYFGFCLRTLCARPKVTMKIA
ncbi:MAG: bifunctional diaminohydroxyphosphoribosylaminopyrimidine deaminase/5-amino-6-(5-phosphoribosylamino)uracil reductase RibD, partial [Pseudomonadota bacterium]